MYKNNDKKIDENKLKIIIAIISIVVLSIIVVSGSITIADMSSFIHRDNVEIKGLIVIEHLEDRFKIYEKAVSKYKPRNSKTRNAYVLKLEGITVDFSLDRMVNKTDFDTYNIGDEVVVARDVYYTLNGVRLGNKDIPVKRVEEHK